MTKHKKNLKRLQGAEWHKVKDSMQLLSVSESRHGNLCGIYTDGKKKYVHWLNDDEVDVFLEKGLGFEINSVDELLVSASERSAETGNSEVGKETQELGR